jgi:hypothetical protein
MACALVNLDGGVPVNNEKTIFMKWEEDDFIIHGVFVHDFATIPTSQKLKDEFEALYSADFNVTGRGIMTTFLGLEAEQSDDGISLHLDTYIKELVEEYKDIHKKFIKPKSVPMSPRIVLDKEDCPELPDPIKQKHYHSMVAKVHHSMVAKVCSILDQIRYFVPRCTSGPILRFGWTVAAA